MAIGVKALPITFVAHAVAIVAAIMVLVWCLGFRGGLAWEDTNKNLIFNVSSFLFWVYGIFRVFFFFYQTGLWLQLCPVFCRCWFYQTALLCLCPTRFEFAPVCLIIIFEVWLSECWLVSSHRIKLRSSPQQVFFFFLGLILSFSFHVPGRKLSPYALTAFGSFFGDVCIGSHSIDLWQVFFIFLFFELIYP